MVSSLGWLLSAALASVTLAAPARVRSHTVHNPNAVEVTQVHMVLSSHFDGGCKTPGCTDPANLMPGEPNLCAKVGAGNAHGAADPYGTGEPFNYHIINRYFDEFLPRAIANADAMRRTDTPYTYMTQSWLLDLYLDCSVDAGLVGWVGSGSPIDTNLLHCPNGSAVDAMRQALRRGDIFVHGFPHNGEASFYPDASIFRAALSMSQRVAKSVGAPEPSSVSQRDVPGTSGLMQP